MSSRIDFTRYRSSGLTGALFTMGHEVASMSAVYRERINDERLKAVTDHVHDWLFASPQGVNKGQTG